MGLDAKVEMSVYCRVPQSGCYQWKDDSESHCHRLETNCLLRNQTTCRANCSYILQCLRHGIPSLLDLMCGWVHRAILFWLALALGFLFQIDQIRVLLKIAIVGGFCVLTVQLLTMTKMIVFLMRDLNNEKRIQNDKFCKQS